MRTQRWAPSPKRDRQSFAPRKHEVQTDDWQASVREGITIDFPEGVRLACNRSYGGNMAGSYSVTLRPDITLTVGDELHLLDAKES